MKLLKLKKFNKNMILCSLIVILSNTLVFGSTSLAKDNHEVYDTNIEQMEEKNIDTQEYIETEISFADEAVENPFTRAMKTLNWTINKSSLVNTSSFNKTAGSTVTISVTLSSAGGKVNVGIIQPDGSKRYISPSGKTVTHTFTLGKSGNHRVFIENNTSSSITASGTYTY